MGFATTAATRRKAVPAELYLFVYGPGPTQYFAYAQSEKAISYDAGDARGEIEYLPLPIKRGEITASGSLDKSTLEVRMPRNAGFAGLFDEYPPTEVVSLFIRQGHVGDPDFLVIWSGRVTAFARDASEALINCEPIATSMRRAGARINYQIGCPLALYGVRCGANKVAATTTLTVTAVSSNVVTLPDWTTDALKAKYRGGLLEWDTAEGVHETRTILQVNIITNAVTLAGPARGLEAGMDADVIYGCNHKAGLEDDCIVLHDNIVNYGGCWWIPIKNPFGVTNNFY